MQGNLARIRALAQGPVGPAHSRHAARDGPSARSRAQRGEWGCSPGVAVRERPRVLACCEAPGDGADRGRCEMRIAIATRLDVIYRGAGDDELGGGPAVVESEEIEADADDELVPELCSESQASTDPGANADAIVSRG